MMHTIQQEVTVRRRSRSFTGRRVGSANRAGRERPTRRPAIGAALATLLAAGCASLGALDTRSSAGLLAQGDRLFQLREYDQAREVYERAADARDARPVRVEALAQVARMHSLLGDEAAGRPWLERAGELATPDEPGGWSRYLLVRGIYEREAGDPDDALATFAELYAYCLENGLVERAIDAAHMAALVGDVESQIAWAHRGIGAAEVAGQDPWLAKLWNNLGWTYEERDRLEEALVALETAREYHHRGTDDHAKLVADWSVARLLRRVGRTEEARALLLETRDWAQRRYTEQPGEERLEWVGHCQNELGELDIAEGRLEDGLAMLRRGRETLIRANIESWGPEWLASLEERIAEVEREAAAR